MKCYESRSPRQTARKLPVEAGRQSDRAERYCGREQFDASTVRLLCSQGPASRHGRRMGAPLNQSHKRCIWSIVAPRSRVRRTGAVSRVCEPTGAHSYPSVYFACWLAPSIRGPQRRWQQLGALSSLGKSLMRPNQSFHVVTSRTRWRRFRVTDQITRSPLRQRLRVGEALCSLENIQKVPAIKTGGKELPPRSP